MNKDNVYSSCSEIPIYNFFEIVKTTDMSLLYKSKDLIGSLSDEELYEVFSSILMEYNALTNNLDLIREYKAQLEIEYMELRYNVTKKLTSAYLESNDLEVIMLLVDFNWKIDLKKPLPPQIRVINKTLIGLKNKINISKINFVKRFRKNQKETTPNFNLEREIINIEITLPLSYKVDIHVDTISRFIYWTEALKAKNKALSNG